LSQIVNAQVGPTRRYHHERISLGEAGKAHRHRAKTPLAVIIGNLPLRVLGQIARPFELLSCQGMIGMRYAEESVNCRPFGCSAIPSPKRSSNSRTRIKPPSEVTREPWKSTFKEALNDS